MIPYHGTPMTPEVAAAIILMGRHGFVSHAAPQSISVVASVCRSFALDNGAFAAWKSGKPVVDWDAFYQWVYEWYRHPGFDWFLIPDVIDGTEKDNDRLIEQCPLPQFGVPIWHLHESLERLDSLCSLWPRVALGSSGDYQRVASPKWFRRMDQAMGIINDRNGHPRCKIHGLRMLDPKVFTRFPFSSADSTNVARNMNIKKKWRGTYAPTTAAARGAVIAERVEVFNSADRWFSHFELAVMDAEKLR